MTSTPRDLRLMDSLSRTVRPLVPLEPGHVRIYVCGMTVDGPPHLGHARSAVAFDVLVRVLHRAGLRTTWVRNFTDVDDRILKRARDEGVAPEVVAERNLLAYRRAMDALGVQPPDFEPRVTDHVGDVVAMIEALVAKGHAYAIDGDVWFHVPSKPDYGRLSGRDVADQREAVRIEPDPRKRHPADFALWKAAQPGEPSWPSPWGRGRPGWHIECSAMSRALLGDAFDVHGGGSDLLFPHHENEIAQTEAATGVVPSVSTWLHNGMLTVSKEKMAKSVGNVRTVEETLARHPAEAVRAWFLSAHYRSPLELSEQGVAEVERALDRLQEVLGALDALAARTEVKRSRGQAEALARALDAATSAVASDVDEALADDLDTPRALAALLDASGRLSAALSGAGATSSTTLGQAAARSAARLRGAAEPLGLLRDAPEAYALRVRELRLAARGLSPSAVEADVRARADARARGDFATADALKHSLAARGIELRDGPRGTTWRVRAVGGPDVPPSDPDSGG